MRNKKTGIKRVVSEIILIVIGCMIFVLSVLADSALIDLPNILAMKVRSNEDLLFTLFSVQAGIATVGIAIIAIITGTTTESYLGISFSEYITSIKPFVLTHKRLLVTSLALIIVNYFAMSFLMTNLCIAILTISVIIAIHLVTDVYVIFRGTVGMQQDIKEYIIRKYDVERISNIKNELMCAIETNSELTIEYTTATLKEIFEIEVKKCSAKNQTIDLIVTIVAEAFQQVVKQHIPTRTNKMMQLVYELYRIANRDKGSIQQLDLWEHIYRDYYTGLKDLTDEQIKEDFYYYLLHGELYTNLLSGQENLDKDSFLRMYSCWTYNALLLSQTNREIQIQNRIKKDLYDLSSCYIQLDSKDLDEREERIRIQELCYLIKVAIDNGDTELLEKHFFDSYKYRDQNTKHGMVLVVALIYLYYLAAREDLKSGEKIQNNAKEILRRNREFVSHFFYELDIIAVIKEYKSIMDTMLWNWEQMDEGEVKHVVIIDAIEDFFVFSICAETWNKDRIAQMVDIIAPDQMFSIYQRYFATDRKNRTARLFAEYCKLFAEDRYVNDSYEDRLAILEEVFNERYHQEAIKEGKESVLLKEDMDTYAEALRSKFAEFVRKDLSRFRYKSDDEDTIAKQENKRDLLYMKLPNSMIREQRVHSAIIDHMIGRTMSIFFYYLSGNVDYKEIARSTSNKQQCLIDMVEALKITPTIAIGHRDTFWGETDERALQKYTEQLEHFKFPGGYNLYYIIDGNRVGFNVTNIRAEYIDVPAESILEACQKREDGKLYYNITNDIFIPFEESEIIQYVQSTHKIIKIVADISYYCPNEKIGAGIKIVPDTKNDA